MVDPNYSLVGLEIEGFRGINNEGNPFSIGFKPNSVNSVYADNAHGKSSIYDALSFCLLGNVPRFADLNRSEEAESYYTNVFHSSGRASIRMTLSSDDGSADVHVLVERTRQGERLVSSPSGHPNPERLLSGLWSPFTLLDNHTFEKFVDDTPIKRGRSFAALLGLQKLSRTRQALEVLAHRGNLNTDFGLPSEVAKLTQLRSEADRQLRQIDSFYERVTGEPVARPIDVAVLAKSATQAMAAKPIADLLQDATITSVDWSQVRKRIKETEKSELRVELHDLQRRVARLKGAIPSREKAFVLGELRKAIQARQTALAQTEGQQFRNLIVAASEFVRSEDWPQKDVCPVCDSKISEMLPDRLDYKLSFYEEAYAKSRAISDLWSTSESTASFARLISTQTQQEREQYSRLEARFLSGEVEPKDLESLGDLLVHSYRSAVAELRTAESRVKEIQSALPPSLVQLTEQIGFAEQLAQSLAEYSRVSEELPEQEGVVKALGSWEEFVQKAKATFSSAEVALTSRRTQQLESRYQDLYQRITSNSEIVPALVKPTGAESLELRLARFYGEENLSAVTLLSESYRNALAISIYLSAALETPDPPRFLVLDDVTSSFDAGHQFGVMETIRTLVAKPGNPVGPQLIILSHDGLLEKYFDTRGNTTDWHHQRLQGLPPRGNVYAESQDANRIRESAKKFLEAGQKSSAEPLLRQYLEFVLQRVIRKVRIPVPVSFAVRDDSRQVKACLDAITDAVTLHERANSLILTQKQKETLGSVLVPQIIGNWTSHYGSGKPIGVSEYVLLGLLDTIDELDACFQYECACGAHSVMRYYKNLSEKQCGC